MGVLWSFHKKVQLNVKYFQCFHITRCIVDYHIIFSQSPNPYFKQVSVFVEYIYHITEQAFSMMNKIGECQFVPAHSLKFNENIKTSIYKYVRLSLSFCLLLVSYKLPISLFEFFKSSYVIHHEFKMFIWLWSSNTLVLSLSANKEFTDFTESCVSVLLEHIHWCTWFFL